MRTTIDREIIGIISSWLENPVDASHAGILADLLLDKNPKTFTEMWHRNLCSGIATIGLHQYGPHENKRVRRTISLSDQFPDVHTENMQFFQGIRYNDIWRESRIPDLFRTYLFGAFDLVSDDSYASALSRASWSIYLTADPTYSVCQLRSRLYLLFPVDQNDGVPHEYAVPDFAFVPKSVADTLSQGNSIVWNLRNSKSVALYSVSNRYRLMVEDNVKRNAFTVAHPHHVGYIDSPTVISGRRIRVTQFLERMYAHLFLIPHRKERNVPATPGSPTP